MQTCQEYTKAFPEYSPFLNHSAEECAKSMLNGAPSQQKACKVVSEDSSCTMTTIVNQKLGINERVLDMMKASRDKTQEDAKALTERVQKLKASLPDNSEYFHQLDEMEKELSPLQAQAAQDVAFEKILRDLYNRTQIQSNKKPSLDEDIDDLQKTCIDLEKAFPHP